MKIDQLPVEILMDLFSYLPAYDQVSLVNNMFNNIACKVNESICLRIDWRFIERFLCDNVTRSQWLQSIKTSNRKISTVIIEGEGDPFLIRNQHQIVPVLERFSRSIKSLNIESLTTDVSTMGKILSFTSNIERLELVRLVYDAKHESSQNEQRNDDYNLTKLKFLKIHLCDDEFNEVVSRIPLGFLTELQMRSNWNAVTVILIRQFNIKTLVLESMLFRNGTDFDLIMSVVTNLTELEELAIDITDIPADSMKKIWKLKKLRNLLLENNENDSYKLQTLTGLNNTSIEKLSLRWKGIMPPNIVDALARSAPYLSHFNVINPKWINVPDELNPDQELDAIMRNFNYVEVLSIMIFGNPLVDAGNYFNPKLQELSIFALCLSLFLEWLPQLIAAYPNLKKLKLNFNLTERVIEAILNGFTKLESLIVTSRISKIVHDLDCLHNHKDKLKCVSLGPLRENILIDELMKKLRVDFAVVNMSRYRILTVAVDRYAMVRELRTGSFKHLRFY